MKKLFKIIISFTLIFSLISFSALAENSVEVEEPVVQNKLITVNFNVTGLTADDDVTILVFKNDNGTSEPDENNIVYLNQISAANDSISFNLLPNAAEGRYEVRMGGTGVTLTNAGYFTINSILYGDVDGDGDIDSTDAIWILRYELGGFDLSGKNITNGDVDGDSDIDSTDAIWVLRYELGGFDLPDRLEKN